MANASDDLQTQAQRIANHYRRRNMAEKDIRTCLARIAVENPPLHKIVKSHVDSSKSK